MTTILHYEQHAGRLVDQYESLAFEEVHASLLDLLPAPGATIKGISLWNFFASRRIIALSAFSR